jgi:hypothetical protein
MKCYVCLKEGVPLFRTKPKGQLDAGWACKQCCDKLGVQITKEVQQGVAAVRNANSIANGRGHLN